MRRALLASVVVLESIAACSGNGDDSTTGDASSDDVTTSPDTAAPDVSAADAPIQDASIADVAKPPCASNPNKTGLTNRTAQGNAYVAYVPASYVSTKLTPLVIALHGAGDTAQNYLNVIWKGNADTGGFIVIAPEGTAPLGNGFTWNGSDEDLILAAAADVYDCYTIDPKKEIMHGFSAGGIMAYMIGLDHAELFSGIAISSADLESAEAIFGGSLLPSAWKIPVSHTHGTQDQNFPIQYAIQGMDTLIEAGHPFYWHPFDGGHTTTPQFASAMYADLKSYDRTLIDPTARSSVRVYTEPPHAFPRHRTSHQIRSSRPRFRHLERARAQARRRRIVERPHAHRRREQRRRRGRSLRPDAAQGRQRDARDHPRQVRRPEARQAAGDAPLRAQLRPARRRAGHRPPRRRRRRP